MEQPILVGEFLENAVEFHAEKIRGPLAPLTAIREELVSGRCRVPADRAIYRQMVSAPGFPLKKCASVFNKFLRSRHGRYLIMKCAVRFFHVGIFCLKVFYAFLEEVHSIIEESDALAKHVGRTRITNQRTETAECLDGRDGASDGIADFEGSHQSVHRNDTGRVPSGLAV